MTLLFACDIIPPTYSQTLPDSPFVSPSGSSLSHLFDFSVNNIPDTTQNSYVHSHDSTFASDNSVHIISNNNLLSSRHPTRVSKLHNYIYPILSSKDSHS